MASTLKTGKSKFRSSWYDHECYTYKKKAQRSLRRYRNWRSAVRKAEYIQNRKSYKKLLKEKKEAHLSHKISTLFKSLNNPTLFWKEVRSHNPNRRTTNSNDINEWYSYFVNIFQVQRLILFICGEPSDDEYIYRNITDNKILNSHISEDEFRKSIKSLKNNRSPGPNEILNEMISNGHNVLTPFLARVFQSIFERGSFPYEWGKSIIASMCAITLDPFPLLLFNQKFIHIF